MLSCAIVHSDHDDQAEEEVPYLSSVRGFSANSRASRPYKGGYYQPVIVAKRLRKKSPNVASDADGRNRQCKESTTDTSKLRSSVLHVDVSRGVE